MRSIPMPRLLKVLLLLCGVGLLFSSLNVYNVQKIETISPHNGPVESQKLLLGELKVNIKRVNTASKPTVAAKPFVQSEVKYTLLHGYIDDFSEDKSHGWACFPTIDQPVTVKIVDDTTQSVVGEVLANRERVDLATAGVCTGPQHGWIFYFEDAWMRGKHNLAFYAKYEHEGNSLTKLMGVKNVTILAPPSNLTAITSKSGINSQVEWENTANAYDVSENGLVTKVSRTNKNQIVYDHAADSVNFMLVRERNGVNTGLWSSTMETFPKVYNSEQSFFPQFHNSMESKLKNKKVLIWTHNLHLEGAPICAYQLAVYLKQRSVDIVVQAGGNGTLYTYLQANGIDVIFGFSVKSPEKYSLVILNTVTASKVLELQPALWPKAVWWVHEQEPALFKHYNMDLLEEVAMAVFPTKGCLDTYKDWNRGHFVVVPNGVDLSRRDRIQASNTREGFRKSLGIKPDEFVVTLHGTFAPNKGQLALLEVANKLKDQNVKFLLVGATESLQDYQKQMMDYINTNQLSKVLLFYKNPFVDLFYGSTDLHISNTQLTESFGLTLIEAMSFGVPVVAPDLQGMSAIVQHNKTGYLFPPQNADELAKWIMFMKNRPTASANMGQVAKAYVESTYSLDIVMSKFEEALSLVISTFNKS